MDKMNGSKKKRVKRLSGSLAAAILGSSATPGSNNNISPGAAGYYYPSHFISKPCDQLFGPASFDSLASESSVMGSSPRDNELEPCCTQIESEYNAFIDSFKAHAAAEAEEKHEYIPTPKWNKLQNAIFEELYKKTRYPKANELKLLAQRFNVMDCDIEEWFRKRRGRDRRAKRKNESLKSLMDNYIEMKC